MTVRAMALPFSLLSTRVQVLFGIPGRTHTLSAEAHNITEDSDGDEMNDPGLVSIAFGGLHLAKSPTNFLRNNVLTLNGQNYGLHVINCVLRNSPGPYSSIISNLQAAV